MLQPKKPAFDPNKPFEPVSNTKNTDSNKPAFDPNKPFDAVNSEQNQEVVAEKPKPEYKSKFRLPQDFGDKLPQDVEKRNKQVYTAPTFSEPLKQKTRELSEQFKTATQYTNTDEATVQERLKTEEANGGFWGGVKQGFIQTLNKGIDVLGKMADLPEQDVKSLKFTERRPFEDQIKEVREEALQNKTKLTPEEELDLAKKKFIKKQRENIFIDKANSFVDNISQQDKRLLEIDAYDKSVHLGEENLKLLKTTKALQIAAQPDIDKYNDLKAQVNELLKNKKPITKDLVAQVLEVESSLKERLNLIRNNYDSISKNQKDLGTAKQEFDIFKRENRDMVNFMKNLGVTTEEIGMGLLDFSHWAGYMSGGPSAYAAIATAGTRKEMRENIQAQRENLRKPVDSVESLEGFLNYTGDLLANQLPILAVTATGYGGLAALGMSSSGQKFGEMETEMMDGKAYYKPWQMATAVPLNGGAEIISELPTMSILKRAGRVLQAAKNEAGGELLKKTFYEKFKEASKDYVSDMGKELAGEEFTQLTQNFTDKYLLNKKNVGLLDNTGTVFKDTVTLTSMLKAAPHIAGPIIRQTQTKDEYKTIDENGRKILELAKSLDNENLLDSEKAAIQKQIDVLTKQSSDLMNKSIQRTGNLADEQYNEVIRLNSEAAKLKEQAREIQINSNLENKQELIDTLNEEYKKIQNRRQSILTGAISVVEILPQSEQDTLRKQALEDLVTEKNPDGKPGVEFTEAEILDRANQIYSESKANESAITEPTQISTEPQSVNTEANENESSIDAVFNKAGELHQTYKNTFGASEKRKIAEERRAYLEQHPTAKYIDDNFNDIVSQLEQNNLLTKKGDC